MPAPLPFTPAEKFGAIIRWLTHYVVTRGLTGQLARHLVPLIVDRLRRLNQRFKTLAARIAAGRYVPRRRTAAPGRTGVAPPRDPLPRTFGWLFKLAPETTGQRAWLEGLLRDPDVVALMQAAPAAMARTLRPLCRALAVEPPPILAPPPRLRRPQAAPAAQTAPAAEAEPPPRPNAPPPPRHHKAPRRRRKSPAQPCAPPLPHPA